MLNSDSNKAQKELNQNVIWKMFRITVDYLGAIFDFEINVLLNRRPMCLFLQPMPVLIFMDPVITVQRKFDHY